MRGPGTHIISFQIKALILKQLLTKENNSSYLQRKKINSIFKRKKDESKFQTEEHLNRLLVYHH